MSPEQGFSDAAPENPSVKMDSLIPPPTLRKALQDGVFRLKVLVEPDSVKMDSWIVELSSIHEGFKPISRRIKR